MWCGSLHAAVGQFAVPSFTIFIGKKLRSHPDSCLSSQSMSHMLTNSFTSTSDTCPRSDHFSSFHHGYCPSAGCHLISCALLLELETLTWQLCFNCSPIAAILYIAVRWESFKKILIKGIMQHCLQPSNYSDVLALFYVASLLLPQGLWTSISVSPPVTWLIKSLHSGFCAGDFSKAFSEVQLKYITL